LYCSACSSRGHVCDASTAETSNNACLAWLVAKQSIMSLMPPTSSFVFHSLVHTYNYCYSNNSSYSRGFLIIWLTPIAVCFLSRARLRTPVRFEERGKARLFVPCPTILETITSHHLATVATSSKAAYSQLSNTVQ
jgi:hypothetical protein